MHMPPSYTTSIYQYLFANNFKTHLSLIICSIVFNPVVCSVCYINARILALHTNHFCWIYCMDTVCQTTNCFCCHLRYQYNFTYFCKIEENIRPDKLAICFITTGTDSLRHRLRRNEHVRTVCNIIMYYNIFIVLLLLQ